MLHTGIKNGLYYMCTLYPYIEQAGHGRGHLGGKDDSCNSTLPIYTSTLVIYLRVVGLSDSSCFNRRLYNRFLFFATANKHIIHIVPRKCL